MQLSFANFERAPGRGRYPRGSSSAQRFVAQRERLLRATAIARLEGESSVTRVTALSGVGRTTFYECFDDFEHAVAAVIAGAARRFTQGLTRESARLDLAQLCAVWLRCVTSEPLSSLVALQAAESDLLTQFGQALLPLFPDAGADARWMHALACAQASARATALARLSEGSVPVRAGEQVESHAALTEAAQLLTRSIRCLLTQAP